MRKVFITLFIIITLLTLTSCDGNKEYLFKEDSSSIQNEKNNSKVEEKKTR